MSRVIVDTDHLPLPDFRFQVFRHNIITDVWLCGHADTDSDGNKFDGAFPLGFLKKLKDSFYFIFKDLQREEILHVCSGRVPKTEGMRLDIDAKYSPDYLCNAEEMTPVQSNQFRFVLSDTPYNKDASEKYYDKPMLNKSKVLREMNRVCKVGGFVAVFDESFPVSPPRNLKCVARIAVTTVPNLTFRALTVFQKMEIEK